MPNTLPPLPPPDDAWPPRDLRRLHPQTLEQLRTILREYDTGTHDLATAIQKITRTVQRDGMLWLRDRQRDPTQATGRDSHQDPDQDSDQDSDCGNLGEQR